MPWRTEPREPYAVWLSEVMLQQTRVASVVPYYERFLRRFPDVRSLAEASLDEVLSAWSGLGYYRRARALHEAAKLIVVQFGGAVPRDPAALLSLPGVGPYTAAAIGSIAFGVPAAVVDGNVSRVMARLFALQGPVQARPMREAIERHADQLLDRSEPGRFNEAMMDLGALVCTPRSPICLVCPLQPHCQAFREGIQAQLPVSAPRRASPRVECTSLVAWHDERVLLARRRAKGLFGGLWEPLTWPVGATQVKRSAAARAIGTRRWVDCGLIEHVLTHRVLVVRVVATQAAERAELSSEQLPEGYEQAAWCEELDIRERGVSSLARRVIERAKGPT